MQPHPLNVLVVDDCPIMRSAAVKLLKRDGHRPTAVTSLREAQAQLNEREFDLVLSDFDLGGGDTGYHVLDTTRRLRNPPPFVLMSSWMARDIDPMGTRLKGVPFLNKPFNPAAFQVAVHDAVVAHGCEARLAS